MQKSLLWILGTLSLVTFFPMVNGRTGLTTAASAEKRESLETRLRRLEDREEIRQLLTDYGRFLDRGDFLAFSELFSEKEGEWIGGLGGAKSAQAIRKLMEDTIGKGGAKPAAPSRHLFTNEMISVDGDMARATTHWMFVVQSDAGRPQPFYLGHYEDSLVREGGRWKFLKRVVYGDIPVDDPLTRK